MKLKLHRWLAAAVFPTTMLVNANALALQCIQQTPFTFAAQYQQADYVGQLMVLADGIEMIQDFWVGPMKRMQVKIIGNDVRGPAFGTQMRAALVDAATSHEQNAFFAWLKPSTHVGTVLDVMIPKQADFEAGHFRGYGPCSQSVFERGKLDALLPPKGKGGAVLLEANDDSEIIRRFGLKPSDMPGYVLVKTGPENANSQPIPLILSQENGRPTYQALGLPSGTYRLAPAFYPPGFSRANFATDTGTLKGDITVIDRGAIIVRGGVFADQTLIIEGLAKNPANAGQSASNPALIMPKLTYEFEFLGAHSKKSPTSNQAPVKFDMEPDSSHPLLEGRYRIRTRLFGVDYVYSAPGDPAKDGIWDTTSSPTNAGGRKQLRTFPALDQFEFVTLRVDFKDANGQAIAPGHMSVIVADPGVSKTFARNVFFYRQQPSQLAVFQSTQRRGIHLLHPQSPQHRLGS